MYNQTHNTMAKIYGINGVITGKLGAAVYAVRNGEQISRQYQPIVANPQTAGQTAARAKLKLVSQMSAVMGPVIAIRREGAVSSRNLFTKVNYPLATFTGNTANIQLESIQLTKSSVTIPALNVTKGEGATLNLALAGNDGIGADRVVYCVFVKQSDDSLRFATSRIVTVAGADNRYAETLSVESASDNYVVYAYSIRDNNGNAKVAFGNVEVVTAETVAKLVTSRTLSETDITLSRTVGQQILAA